MLGFFITEYLKALKTAKTLELINTALFELDIDGIVHPEQAILDISFFSSFQS